MLIQINGVSVPNPKSYSITRKNITRECQNSLGDTFIDIINTKRSIDLAWGALTQNTQASIVDAVSEVVFPVIYTDENGVVRTGTFKSSDPKFNMLVYLEGKSFWADLSITLTEL